MTRFRLPPWLVCSREGSRQGWIEYLHTVAFFSHLVQPFNARASQYSCRYFFGFNSPAARARELFKPSTVSGSLLVVIETNFVSVVSLAAGELWPKTARAREKFCLWKQLKSFVLVKTIENNSWKQPCSWKQLKNVVSVVRLIFLLDAWL